MFRTFNDFVNVVGFGSKKTAETFAEIWYQVFVWALMSSVIVHVIAAIVAFFRLRKHKIWKWIVLLIMCMGVISPITGGVITSAAIAGVYRASDFEMKTFYALVWGVVQTLCVVFISFTRILATL